MRPLNKTHPVLDKLILFGFFLSGFAALSYEQIWTQLLMLVYGASTYAFSVMLTCFFIGLALGSYLISRVVDRLRMPIITFSFVELAIGLFGLLLLPVFTKLDEPYLRFYLTAPSYHYFLLSWFIIPFFLLFPTTLMGATLPLVSRIFAADEARIGTAIGEVFSANTFGSIAGAFLTGFVLIPSLGVEKATLIAALANISVALLLFLYSDRLLAMQGIYSLPLGRYFRKRKRQFYSLLFVSLLLSLFIASYRIDPTFAGVYYAGKRFSSLEEWKEAKESFEIIYSRFGLYGLVMVGRDSEGLYLAVNGKTEASTTREDMETQYLIAYLPLMIHGNAKDVLNIGLGGGFTLAAIATMPVEKIDNIEINPLVAEVAEKYFSQYNNHVLRDPRVKLIFADGRNHLWHSSDKYDVIISEPSNPWISGEGHLFTKEFFEIVRQHLKEDGIFCQWAPMYEHDSEDIKIMLRTISSVFPYVQVYNSGADMIILASQQEINPDFSKILSYLSREEVRRSLATIYGEDRPLQLADELFKTFLLDSEEVKEYVRGEQTLNTDDHTVLEFRSALNTIKKKYHDPRHVIEPLNDIIAFKKSYTGSPVFTPPLSGLVASSEDRDTLLFLGLEVSTGNNWSLSDLNYGHMLAISKEGTVMYSLGKSAVYSLPNQGKLAVVGLDMSAPPPEEVLGGIVREVFGLDEVRVVGSYRGEEHIFHTFEVSAARGRLLGMSKAWYCEHNGILYIAIAAFPAGEGDAGKALEALRCLH